MLWSSGRPPGVPEVQGWRALLWGPEVSWPLLSRKRQLSKHTRSSQSVRETSNEKELTVEHRGCQFSEEGPEARPSTVNRAAAPSERSTQSPGTWARRFPKTPRHTRVPGSTRFPNPHSVPGSGQCFHPSVPIQSLTQRGSVERTYTVGSTDWKRRGPALRHFAHPDTLLPVPITPGGPAPPPTNTEEGEEGWDFGPATSRSERRPPRQGSVTAPTLR